MRTGFLILIMAILLATATYFIGRKNGAGQTKTDIVQNVALVQEIAQLASLDVQGETRIKITNRGDDHSVFDKFKDYFTENTLMVSVPYQATYGVDLKNQQMTVDTKNSKLIVHLPACKLLSLQLKLDRIESMSQTGILNSVTLDEFKKAQKQLYLAANQSLENNQGYIKLAEDNISGILTRYYKPLGYTVTCIFDNKQPTLKP